MKRREFLAAGASLSIAAAGGCTGCAAVPSASLSMEAVTDAGIAKRVTSTPEPDPDNDRYVLVRAAVENGSVTREATEPLVSTSEPIFYDGGVYEIHHEIVDSKPARTFTITLDPAEDPEAAEVVAFEALPEVDRRKFDERGWDGDFLGFGTGMLYLEREILNSALVPEPDRPVIEWPDGTRGRFTVGGSYESPLNTYRYTSETLYESASKLGATLRERYGFALDGLSQEEREIVEQATDGPDASYVVSPDEEPPEGMQRLAERFRDHEEVRHLSARADTTAKSTASETVRASGSYVVRYEGEVYWTEFHIDETTVQTER